MITNLADLRALNEMFNREKMWEFQNLGDGGQYSEEQKEYAFQLIETSGLRATARILQIPRRTLQRWCKKYDFFVKPCPDWVVGWAKWRRKRREFWKRRGYY